MLINCCLKKKKPLQFLVLVFVLVFVFPSPCSSPPNTPTVYLQLIQTRMNWCLRLCYKTSYFHLTVIIVFQCYWLGLLIPFSLETERTEGSFISGMASLVDWFSPGTEVKGLAFKLRQRINQEPGNTALCQFTAFCSSLSSDTEFSYTPTI